MIVFSSFRNEILTKEFDKRYSIFNKIESIKSFSSGFFMFHFGSSIGTHYIITLTDIWSRSYLKKVKKKLAYL